MLSTKEVSAKQGNLKSVMPKSVNETSNEIKANPTNNSEKHLSETSIQDNNTLSETLRSTTEQSTKTTKSSDLPQTIALLTMSINLIFIFFIIISLGLIPVLIPIGLSVIMALITFASIDDSKNKTGAVSPKRKLWYMLTGIVGIWSIFLLIVFANLSPVVAVAVIGFSILLLLILIGKGVILKKDSIEEQFDETETQSSEKEDISANEEEDNTMSQQNAIPPKPLRPNQLFPGTTSAMVVFIMLGFIIGLALLAIGAVVSALGGVISGPLFFLLLIPLAFIIIGVSLGIKRSNLYRQYLNDIEKRSSDTQNIEEKYSTNTKQRVTGATSLVLGLLLLLFIIIISVLFILL